MNKVEVHQEEHSSQPQSTLLPTLLTIPESKKEEVSDKPLPQSTQSPPSHQLEAAPSPGSQAAPAVAIGSKANSMQEPTVGSGAGPSVAANAEAKVESNREASPAPQSDEQEASMVTATQHAPESPQQPVLERPVRGRIDHAQRAVADRGHGDHGCYCRGFDAAE